VAPVDLLERADEARLLRLDLAQHVLNAAAHFTHRPGGGQLATDDAVIVELVQLERHSTLIRRHHCREVADRRNSSFRRLSNQPADQ